MMYTFGNSTWNFYEFLLCCIFLIRKFDIGVYMIVTSVIPLRMYTYFGDYHLKWVPLQLIQGLRHVMDAGTRLQTLTSTRV